MKIFGAKVHPLADAFPLMEGKDFDDLVESIGKSGLQQPVVTLHSAREMDEGKPFVILDGRNRLRAIEVLQKKGRWHDLSIYRHIEPAEQYCDPTNPEELRQLVASLNIHRRHLTAAQRAQACVQLGLEAVKEKTRKGKAKGQSKGGGDRKSKNRLNHNCGSSDRDVKAMHANSAEGRIAKEANVGRRVAARAIKIKKAEEEKVIAPGTTKKVIAGKVKAVDVEKEIDTKRATSPRKLKRATTPAVKKPADLGVDASPLPKAKKADLKSSLFDLVAQWKESGHSVAELAKVLRELADRCE